MNKRQLYITVAISLFFNMILLSVYFHEKNSYTEDIAKLEVKIKDEINKNKEAQNQLEKLQINTDIYTISNDAEIRAFVKKTFEDFFNYSNRNFITRFDEFKKHATDDIISQLKGAGDIANVKVQFENKVNKIDIYITSESNNQAKSLVKMETQYSIQGESFSPKNEFYEIKLVKNNSEWKISELKLMGAFESFDGN